MAKAFAKFVLLLVALLINVLPTFIALYGQKYLHKHSASKHQLIHQPEFGHGQHDVSWDLIKKKHLNTPPSTLKMRMIFAICLAFGLFFCFRQVVSNISGFRFAEAKLRVLICHRYLYLQSFLI